ncbi:MULTISPECIES: plantaricin C family lantibiotic [unclassified Lysinibacillus]|uniref:plantaricin C family lantibiotic n=1 Tax=unclassified Lysinibacillus TaxID=2636778 RepID=UPI002012AD54|nr:MULTISPECIES: plantaricin C family lantibiotic [unclassified Lysinibacillus]MCL1695625.1 plantaricin C family lantibiotic [Lysinibacillus sp. BPa_S21]MCL1700130.1 plantaricin C family lantibiotic [Lysinibacillus sp. Bpr_S20]
MKKSMVTEWKNPYIRSNNIEGFPIENPVQELSEMDMLNVNGGVQERWAETILTSLACAAASYILGNPGHVCTLTVECQKKCN